MSAVSRLCRTLALPLAALAGLGASSIASARSVDEARVEPAVLEQAALRGLQGAVEAFGAGRDAVQVEVVDLRVVPDSLATLTVDGVGRLRIDNGDWIPLRFDASYDLVESKMGDLRVLPIARVASAAARVVESGLEERVSGQVAARILTEFPDQPAEIVFVDVEPTSEARGHVAFHGTGLVDFSDEGAAPVSFSAILDRASGLLVALDYDLEVIGAHGDAPAVEAIAAN
jgi:hypothetical protein